MLHASYRTVLIFFTGLLALAAFGAFANDLQAQEITRVPAGGAPARGSGDFEIPFARVIDGDTIETYINGDRVGIGLIGVSAAAPNTPCGEQATTLLQSLVYGGPGLQLEEDTNLTFDARQRRMYTVKTRDGRSLAAELVKRGAAKADGRGKERSSLLTAQAAARKAKQGCLWTKQRQKQKSRPKPKIESDDVNSPAGSFDLPKATVPGGFTEETVVSGVVEATDFTFLPDGRILLAGRNGQVRLSKNGQLLGAPVIDISSKVNTYWDHGLLGIAADPDFATNGYIYLLYTYENDPAQTTATKTGRLSRFTMVGDTAAAGSEVVILGTQVGATCNALPVGADCIPSDSPSHSVGTMRFAPDKTMFLTLGDAGHFNYVDDNALRAQNLDLLSGKLLRITRDGQGLPSNPFWSGNPNANRSKVWAYGVRNSFRFSLRPGTDLPYLGDVGWNTWEEINVATRGANFGWPCFEGLARQGGYESKPICQALYAQGATAAAAPLVTYAHNGTGAAITGGAFYGGTAYPAEFRGAYFFADHVTGALRYVKVDQNNAVVGGPTDFGGGIRGAVSVQTGPDGDLYYLQYSLPTEIRRIRYIDPGGGGGGTTSCPSGKFLAEYFNNDSLAGAPTFTRCEDAVGFDWGSGGPGNGVSEDNFSVRWSGRTTFQAGEYTFTVQTDDGTRVWLDGELIIDAWKDQGVTTYRATRTLAVGEHAIKMEFYDNCCIGVGTLSWQLSSANTPPVATLSAPVATQTFRVGDTVTFAGSATDAQDGPLPTSALSWRVEIQHCTGAICHTHLLTTASGAGGSFVAPDHEADFYLRLVLTATDSAGLAATASVDLQPQNSNLTLATVPSGLQVTINGVTGPAPLTAPAVVGGRRTVAVASPQNDLTFRAWSDGGAQTHDVTIGAADLTLTTTFAAGPGAPPVPTISAPAAGATYKVGDAIAFAGAAADPQDGPLPPEVLGWKVEAVRCPGGVCQAQTLATASGAGGSFTIPNHADDAKLRFTLTAADSGGQTASTSVDLQPQTARITLDTVPSGLQVSYAGETGPAPLVRTAIVGATRSIAAPSPQAGRQLEAWSDGGAAAHDVTVGPTDLTLAATFASIPNGPPVPSISAPAAGASYKIGDALTFTGSATDPQDGPLPPAALSWRFETVRCPGGACQVTPLGSAAGAGGSLTVPDHPDDARLRLTLTAADSGGQTASTLVDLQPQTSQVTLATNPAGLQVSYGGETAAAPLVRTAVIGGKRTIGVPSPQGSLLYQSWSDGGAQTHDVTVAATAATYTASLAPPATPPLLATYSSSPPTSWGGSETKSYAVTVTNGGSQTWPATGTNRVRLSVHFGTASDAPHDGWATDYRFELPADVAPGQSVTLNVNVQAPSATGSYVLRHRMVKEFVAWFDQVQKTNVTVGGVALAASYSSSPPTSWTRGQTRTYNVTVTNTGSTTWLASGTNRVRLGVHFGTASDTPHDGWATDQRFALPRDVAPGQSVTLSVSVKAPSTARSYVLRHRLVKEQVAWFDQIQRTSVTVQ